jgi:putative glutamine amidotransferase
VWRAGGDPVTYLAVSGSDWSTRLEGVAGVLLCGGGDVDPRRYGQEPHPSVYDVDSVQDDCDLSLAQYARAHQLPTLAICRGLHIINVLYGGTLVQDLPQPHRHLQHEVSWRGEALSCSCYHHQAVATVGQGLVVTAQASDGTIEALAPTEGAWLTAVQWHPEDTAEHDPKQADIFAEFVLAARHAAK